MSHASKKLSWLLRHGAREAGVTMDAAGWVDVDEALRALGLSREAFDAVVRDNDKSRFEVRGEHVRASQGHSVEGTPVTLEALEASWMAWGGEGTMFHGTSVAAAEAIAREGIVPGARTHVHLAESPDSVVGKRAGVDVLIEVAPARLRAAGLQVFQSPNGVLLARRVPPECMLGARGMTQAGRAAASRLTEAFRARSR